MPKIYTIPYKKNHFYFLNYLFLLRFMSSKFNSPSLEYKILLNAIPTLYEKKMLLENINHVCYDTYA